MKLGHFIIEQLSEGQFEVFEDGTINRKPTHPSSNASHSTPGELLYNHSSHISIDPIYISDGINHILLDPGLGWGLDAGSVYGDVSNVKTNLDIFGQKPEDITHVVLTHLHYDHAAGSSYTNASIKTCPTFPNATYFVQRREWAYALQQIHTPSTQQRIGYQLDDFYRLVADNHVKFLDKNFVELLPGIKVIWTGGHTPGHQIVRIEDGPHYRAYYLSDLLPDESHLNRYAMRPFDVNPLHAKKMKIRLLRSAYQEKAILLFYHSLYQKAGKLKQDQQKKYVLRVSG